MTTRPHLIKRLHGVASSFIDVERHKLERATHEIAIALIAIFSLSLLALVGATMLLLGLAYWLEPTLGAGPAFVLIGAMVVVSSLVAVLVLHQSWKDPDPDS